MLSYVEANFATIEAEADTCEVVNRCVLPRFSVIVDVKLQRFRLALFRARITSHSTETPILGSLR